MLVVDLVRRLGEEAPEARLAAVVSQVNDLVSRIWEDYRWPFYVTDTSLTASLAFTNLTVSNGAEVATVVDADSDDLFNDLHVGKRMTIAGESYTVGSVTDANTLVLTGLSDDTGTALAGSLPRVVLDLPTTFGRMYGRPTPTSTLNQNLEDPYFGLNDPRDYLLRGPVSGVYTLELRILLTEDHTIRYVRRPTACTGPGSTVDIDTGLEKALYQGLLAALLQGVDARNEIHLAQLQQRIRRADGLYAIYLKEARAVAGTVSERVGKNRSWGFN